MAYRKILTGLITAAAATFAVACAQDGPHTHPAMDAANASQDAEIAKALSADALIVEGMADLDRRIDALEAATAGLTSSTADLDARVKALEDATPPDPKPLPSISINAAPQSAAEGASFVFTLARTGDLAIASSVAYAASGAANAADFAGGVIPSGVVSFAAGDASGQVTVKTVDDATVEPDEAFTVTLSNPVGAVLGQPSASATIVNNDVATPPPPTAAAVSVDRATRFQTMSGWEVTGRLWEQNKTEDRYDASWLADRDEIINDLVNEAGVNRLRLELQSGAENPVDYWSRFVAGQDGYTAFSANYYNNINDNADPASANAGGFQWSQLDYKVDNILLPLRAALAARGEALYVNLNVVDFGNGTLGSLDISANPAEYAELVTEAFKHLKSKYGITPDALEITLEPEQGGAWTGAEIGAAIKAAKARLAAAGFSPKIIAPSTMNASNAVPYYDAAVSAGASADMLAFHTYGTTLDATIAAIAAKAKAAGIQTGMLEKTGGDVNQFYRDLTIGNVSAWQQWAIAHKIDSGAYLLFADPAAPAGSRITLASRTRGLAQIWRHVRAGAVRIGAATADAGLKPLAFVRPDGGVTVAVITTRARSFSVDGLPAGVYRIEYSTASAVAVDAGKVVVGSNGVLALSIPASGVVAAYPDKATVPPPPPPPTGALFPNIDDGKPIVQLGIEKWTRAWGSIARVKNKWDILGNLRMFAPGVRDPYSTALKSPGKRIELGELDTFTGWQKIDPGVRGSGDETFLFEPRIWQSKGQADVQTGKWIYVFDVKSGDSFQPNLTGWTEAGSVANFGTASSPLINGGAPFSFDRLRFEIDHDAGDTFLGPYTARAVNGAWFRVHYAGRDGNDYATFQKQPWTDEHLANAAKYKVWRFMDPICTNDAKYVKADDMIRIGADYLAHGCGNSWYGKLPANDHYRIGGFSFTYAMKGALAANSTLHWNIPNTFGFGVLDRDAANGIFSNNFRKSYGSAELQSAIDAHLPRIEEMKTEARAEYAKLFDRMLDEMIAVGWEDNRALILEDSNEMWGTQFATQNRANYIIEEYLFKRPTGGNVTRHGNSTLGMGGGGYWANLMLTEWKAAVARKKPGQAWVFGIGAKINDTSNNSINAFFNGWKLYSSDYPAASSPLSELTVWHTDYISDNLKYTRPGVNVNMFDAPDEATWNRSFLALYASGGEKAIFDHGRDFLLSDSAALSSSAATAIMKKIEIMKGAITAVGAQYGGAYEGSDHNNENKSVSSALFPDPAGRIQTQFDAIYGQGAFLALRRNWNRSDQARDVFAAYFAMRLAIDPASQISNYEELMAGPQNFEPWDETVIGEFAAPPIAPASGIAAAYHEISRLGSFVLPQP